MSNKINKTIEVLTDFEHIIKRPTIYVGSVKKSEENIPIIEGGLIKAELKEHSVGMYKLFDEVFSNSVDEAKRMSVQMKKITVDVDSKTNMVIISDTGDGFTNGSAINKKSGLSNIATAVSMLRAGSNFNNDDISESIVGTNGMGVSLVNALSERFDISTVNEKEIYYQCWNRFKASSPTITNRPKSRNKGTTVSFIPREDVFDGMKWDYKTIRTYLLLRKKVLETEQKTSNLKLEFVWNGKTEPIVNELNPDWQASTPIGDILIWGKKEDSASFSFVNSALCTGIHQKIILDRINGQLDDSLGHHFYDVLLILNLPPGIVRFGDQNKTKFVSKREEVEPTIIRNFDSALNKFFRSEIFKKIKQEVDERKKESELKKIRRDKKSIRIKHSHKYFPPASSRPENLFIVEGLCIDSDQKINVWREDEGIVNVKLSDVMIGDEVITHKNRYRRIINKQKKLKECIEIVIGNGESIKCTKKHRFYVFDNIAKKFYFIEAGNIEIDKHSLVKSSLKEFIGTLSVLEVDKNVTEFPNTILLEDGSVYSSTDDHKYCLFRKETSEFYMEFSRNIEPGDLFCVFVS